MKKNLFMHTVVAIQLAIIIFVSPKEGFSVVIQGVSAPGHNFIHFYYNYTIGGEDATPSVEIFGPPYIIPPIPPGSGYTDVRQTITRDDLIKNTMSLAFFNTSNNMVPLENAYSYLGLSTTDKINVPDFAADLNGDGYAETPLYGAINVSNLVQNYSSLFVNNMPFVYDGSGYRTSDFTQYGYVFSVNDNITYTPGVGFQTPTPLSSTEVIIITDIHEFSGTGDPGEPKPEPSTVLLLGVGALGMAYKNRRKVADVA
jgi:hypothetical protein